MDEIEKKDAQYAQYEIVRKLRHEADIASRTGQYDRLHYLADTVGRVCAERDQLRAEKQEFREEATRWAEEAGRLKALLHDAQRDAERYRWIRDCTKDGCVESAILDHARYAEVKMGKRLDAAIDAAMAAEREGQG